MIDLDKNIKPINQICIENNFSIKRVNLNNFEDIAKELLCDCFKTSVFRGISKSRHLIPGIIYHASKESSNGNELINKERILLTKYNNLSIQYLPYYENCIDFLASAQHYGLSTRLLDWTYDPFIAMYFAINNLNVDDKSYMLSSKINNITKNKTVEEENTLKPSQNLNYHSKKRLENCFELFDILDGRNRHNYIDFFNLYGRDITDTENFLNNIIKNKIFIETGKANPRIVNQKGLFQIFSFESLFKNGSELVIENINNAMVQQLKNCTIYEFSYEDKNFILDKLENLNINQFSLFNDLENLCKYIQKR